MIASTRIQRRYDHRLQAMVKSSGSIDIALEQGIPRSTARGWLRNYRSPFVGFNRCWNSGPRATASGEYSRMFVQNLVAICTAGL
jgi:hypothetical protein